MIGLSCDACNEAYDHGGLLCPYHTDLVEVDVLEKGQPPSYNEQWDRINADKRPG